MIQMRSEERELVITNRATELDTTGQATQLTVWFDCPFCAAQTKARVWSLCGSGKRCVCAAMFYMRGTIGAARKLVEADQALNAGICFVTRATNESRPGRAQVEVFPPKGWLFSGDRHSMTALGRSLIEATEIALANARSTSLVACGSTPYVRLLSAGVCPPTE